MPASDIVPQQLLAQRQNSDGGWGYRGSTSWTEPTAYAMLALAVCPADDPRAAQRGLEWLRARQRADGGWAPQASVLRSTWVTGVALLAVCQWRQRQGISGGLEWLLGSQGEESSWTFRLRNWLLRESIGEGEGTTGWPWFPGSAGWVTPTALAILALEKATRLQPDARAAARIRAGKEFLLARTCQDGGWNYGAPDAVGYAATSYPETTGIALCALHGVSEPRLARSIGWAAASFRRCRSTEGAEWLRLGLLAHGIPVAEDRRGVCRTPMEAALCILAEAAARGRNILI